MLCQSQFNPNVPFTSIALHRSTFLFATFKITSSMWGALAATVAIQATRMLQMFPGSQSGTVGIVYAMQQVDGWRQGIGVAPLEGQRCILFRL